MLDTSALNFARGNGSITVVAQDAISGSVLMVAQADPEAIQRTIETGEMHYCSRTRGLWHKGASSGNTQKVLSLTVDCDGDSVLARVITQGPACHTGEQSCFGEHALAADTIAVLDFIIGSRLLELCDGIGAGHHPPAGSYTAQLFGDRNRRLKKIGEECAEFLVACSDDDEDRAIAEAADLVYHVLVALKPLGLGIGDLRRQLYDRMKNPI
jgi:phosphoribosyl-ATP pyrophosphohydrolase/phosphoribosyl-AMP cyclohydrolase